MIVSMGVARGHVHIKSNADQMACQATILQAKYGRTRNYVVLHGNVREQSLSAAGLHWHGYTSAPKLASSHGAAQHDAGIPAHVVTGAGICPMSSRKKSTDGFLKFTSPSTFLFGSHLA